MPSRHTEFRPRLLQRLQRLLRGMIAGSDTAAPHRIDTFAARNPSYALATAGSQPSADAATQPRNLLLLTLDSCRYDVFMAAATPTTDSYSPTLRAYAPANFTFPSHQAFFVGVLPQVVDDLPYYNRFRRQLIALQEIGAQQVAKSALIKVRSQGNLVTGLAEAGYQTVGAGAMDWFKQDTLTRGFQQFAYTGTDADAQIDFLCAHIDPSRPFFGFINFGETHAPFSYKGKNGRCPVDVRARIMTWPPVQRGPVGQASAAFDHQREAAEFIDARLPRLFAHLPADTIVIVTADHGECFGEDGYWGHGIHHPMVYEVPLAIFRLDRSEF